MATLSEKQKSVISDLDNGSKIVLSKLSRSYYNVSTGEYVTKSIKSLINKGIVKLNTNNTVELIK